MSAAAGKIGAIGWVLARYGLLFKNMHLHRKARFCTQLEVEESKDMAFVLQR